MDLKRSFENRRVMVIGDTGFKGSWLSLWLHELGANVRGYALPPVGEVNHFNLLGLGNLIEHFNGNIRDYDALSTQIKRFQPEIVFHLAAQPLVRLSYRDPKLTFDTNVAGSLNVLEAVRHCDSIRSLVYVTSDKCYVNKEWVWGYRESDELGGRDPYSASKAAAELIFASYMDSFFRKRDGFGAASVRAGNVIGGGDWASDRLIPDIIKSLQNGVEISIRNPNSTRPWQHVLEPLSGYLTVAARMLKDPKEFSGAWNFGPELHSTITVEKLTQNIIKAWGGGSFSIIPTDDGLHEATLLHLNCDKAKQLLSWSPKWGSNVTIKKTIDWYKAVHEGQPARNLTQQQILEYMND